MRTIAPALKAHLDSGATTLCHCWKLETRAGELMGFTDHDNTLSFDSVNFEASAGFNASEIESSLGLSVDNLEAAGALSSVRLDEARLLAGDFDNAKIELWLVNWQDVSQRLLQRRGNLGEVARGEHAFTAELRGLAHALNQPKGRIYQFGCDAVVGDQRCGVDLDAPAFRSNGAIVSAEDGRHFIISGASAFSENWFTRGTMQFTSHNSIVALSKSPASNLASSSLAEDRAPAASRLSTERPSEDSISLALKPAEASKFTLSKLKLLS